MPYDYKKIKYIIDRYLYMDISLAEQCELFLLNIFPNKLLLNISSDKMTHVFELFIKYISWVYPALKPSTLAKNTRYNHVIHDYSELNFDKIIYSFSKEQRNELAIIFYDRLRFHIYCYWTDSNKNMEIYQSCLLLSHIIANFIINLSAKFQPRLTRLAAKYLVADQPVHLATRDLSGACLSNLYFLKEDFSGVDFSGAELVNTRFHSTALNQAIFNNTDLSYSYFFRSDLRKAKFLNKTILSHAKFYDVDLSSANLESIALHYVKFNEVNCKATSFKKAKFIEAEFLKVKLQQANMEEAIIRRGEWKQVWCDNANFKNAQFSLARLYLVDFKSVNFRNVLFSGLNFKSVNFEKTTLRANSMIHTTFDDNCIMPYIIKSATIKHNQSLSSRANIAFISDDFTL